MEHRLRFSALTAWLVVLLFCGLLVLVSGCAELLEVTDLSKCGSKWMGWEHQRACSRMGRDDA